MSLASCLALCDDELLEADIDICRDDCIDIYSGDDWQDEDTRDEWDDDDGLSDVEADAMTLASAGWGTDEDYGYFGGDEW